MQNKQQSLSTLVSVYIEELSEMYDRNEIVSLFSILASTYTEKSLTRYELFSDDAIDDATSQKLKMALKRLMLGEPVQYITGQTSFYDLEIKVNNSVLIPRPETEFLVDILVKKNRGQSNLRILDACTGSGCIALALKANLSGSSITALDLSAQALDVAKFNAEKNQLAVKFIQDDMLNPQLLDDLQFDLIVSNPPYVRELEKTQMHANVLQHEPAMALFVPDANPLLFYRALFEFSANHLARGGSIAFEINEAFGGQMLELAGTYKFRKAEIVKDIHEKDRFLMAEGYEH